MVREIKNPNERLSQNFLAYEFMCPDCGRILIDDELVNILQELRNEIKRPVVITSGYRCEKHNREIGGSPNSYHKKGMASDLVVTEGITVKEVFQLLEDILKEKRQGKGGLIIYTSEGFNHLDVREQEMRGYRLHPAQKVQLMTPEMREVIFKNVRINNVKK